MGAGVGLGDGGVVGGATVGFAVVGAGLGADVAVLDVEVPAAGVVVLPEGFALGERDAAPRCGLGDGPAWLGDGWALGVGVVAVVGVA